MDVILTSHTSLAVLRAARREGSLSLVPTDVTDCPQVPPSASESARLRQTLVPYVGEGAETSPIELVISSSAHRPRVNGRYLHVRTSRVPVGAYLQLCSTGKGRPPSSLPDDMRVLVEGPALALVGHAASLTPLVNTGKMPSWLAVDSVIALGDELCGTYARDSANPRAGRCAYDLPPLSSQAELSHLLGQMALLAGGRLARRAVAHVADGSASPMETLHRMMESLPPRLAGLSIGKPLMNYRIEPTPAQRRAMTIKDGMRPDLFWEEFGIAVEHDGEEGHLTQRGWKSDRERVQDYQVCGISVFPATYDDVRNVTSLNAFALKLCSAIAASGNPGVGKRVRASIRDSDFRARQRELLAMLLPPCGVGET